MALKSFKPTTPGQRQLVIVDRSELWKGRPVKALTQGKREKGGRNNLGRITQRWRGGGHKQRYRIIDFKRTKFDMPAEVVRLEYDPNRSGFIALVRYEDGELSYILAPQRLKEGDKVVSGAPPAPSCSWSAATPATRCSASPRARCAWCAPNAAPRSAPCPTRTGRTSSSARPAATAGSARSPRCAAWR